MVEAVRLVIWDLDETFWTGTLTEGGITQYNQVSHDAVIELAHRGIMSSICSKNSHEDIQAILEEHDLWRYFVFPSIAWTPKGKRLEDIVAATQLRAETIIFIDDNPANRAEAEQCVPGIQIADETLVGRILDDPRFRGKGDPGLTRLAQYKMLESRNVDAILRGTDNKAFLRRSDIRVIIEPDVASHIDRAVELVNRTNQLNFTKRRLPEDIEAARAMLVGEITPFWARSGLVRVIDRYGDHGFCGFFVLLADEQRTATDKPAGLLVHFCFSCRILGIGVESWLFQRLGRPRIQIMGEVLTDLWDEHLVDWVRLVDSASEQASSAPKATNVPMIRLRGGCDQNAIAHYFDVAGSDVRLETNFHRNAQIIRFDKSTMLLPSLELHDAAFQDAITALGYTDADLASDFLGSCPEGTLLLYSAPADAWRQVYIHKELRRVVSFDVPELYVNLTVDMSLEITVGPPQLVIHDGQTVWATELDGSLSMASSKGLMFNDTRLLSNWSIFANGENWLLLNSAAISHFAARVFLTNPRITTQDGDIPEHAMGLVIGRWMEGGVHEDLDLTNFGLKPVSFSLEIAPRSDFADVFEVKSSQFVRRGRITSMWDEGDQTLRTVYENQDFERGLLISCHADCRAVYANGRISFDITLAPGAIWHGCIHYDLEDGDKVITAPKACIEDYLNSRPGRSLTVWREAATKITTSNEEFYRLFHQAVDDMISLRLPIEEDGRHYVVPAAGLPWFTALFGRDSLIVSMQSAMVSTEFARGTLQVLGSRQSDVTDDYRDAEPGKILHEMRHGELAHFKLIPHTPYLRHRRRDAALSHVAAHRLALDRRPRAARTAAAGGRRLPRLDRPVRRPGRRWFPGVPDPQCGRLRERRLEGQRGRRALPRRHLRQGPEGVDRVAGVCVRGLDRGWPRSTTCWARPDLAAEICATRPPHLRAKFDQAFWSDEDRFLRVRAGRRQEARCCPSPPTWGTDYGPD